MWIAQNSLSDLLMHSHEFVESNGNCRPIERKLIYSSLNAQTKTIYYGNFLLAEKPAFTSLLIAFTVNNKTMILLQSLNSHYAILFMNIQAGLQKRLTQKRVVNGPKRQQQISPCAPNQ
jgi:hypothetical protein